MTQCPAQGQPQPLTSHENINAKSPGSVLWTVDTARSSADVRQTVITSRVHNVDWLRPPLEVRENSEHANNSKYLDTFRVF